MAYILIADDDEIVAETAANVLINTGHACGWVTDGLQAMKLLGWRRPDLMLLDQDMPEMTGTQVLRKIRTSASLYDLPVIMFTAKSGAEDEEQALYQGAQDYIRKPFDPKFLVWRVNQVLRARAERPRHMELREVMERESGQWQVDELSGQRSVL
ncbi:MAG: response regulator [Sphingomonadaceae bacterium]|nr:response regulator [Sphingomonadaceae bacterium]MCC0011718.1 response regulator [Rhodobiaceae bacterium]MCP5384540.1 response regulator [Altererythrobacter sp.]MCP5391673.1 response regulator [Sphingomonadaceae bacterium]MCP5395062.1 response regulator [Sphingomonadaceae bacterium]